MVLTSNCVPIVQLFHFKLTDVNTYIVKQGHKMWEVAKRDG